jgi:hypothetical protein
LQGIFNFIIDLVIKGKANYIRVDPHAADAAPSDDEK